MNQLVLGESLAALLDHREKTPRKLGVDFTATGVPVVSAALVDDGRINMQDARFVDMATYRQWMREPLQRGDVLLTSEAPLGRVARVPDDEPLVLGQRLFGLRGRPGVLHSRFLYYALQSEYVRAELAGRSTGTTVIGIRQAALRQVRLPAPDYAQQQAIAEALGALDDKIATNLALVRAADELVRTLFVQLSRRATAQTPIAGIVETAKEQVQPQDVDPSTHYVGLEHIPRRSMWLDQSGNADEVTSAKARFMEGDILFGKLRPYFHKVISAPSAGVCSTDILVLRPIERSLSGFALAALTSDSVVERCSAAAAGTKMPRTSWKDLRALEVPWPGRNGALEFGAHVERMRKLCDSHLSENVALAELRHALLTHLMSGRLRVRDAEKIVGDRV